MPKMRTLFAAFTPRPIEPLLAFLRGYVGCLLATEPFRRMVWSGHSWSLLPEQATSVHSNSRRVLTFCFRECVQQNNTNGVVESIPTCPFWRHP